ncbi:MAG TPA: ACP S-malonyltransferase [Candidatus Hydrogenedentes bacterium]|nr:ACP S-malonyltransferase [Candidatus Hydrogenedentota bacterium]HQE81468.1 ACP S-malonyltransferase [Candidatus Hydrogenedentota bacterium]HQH52903.1 ACP S-malonyltransferase [Candidatus Hydrogenedentota bacterium]
MTAFLFPGQGSQMPGMGADFYESSESARAVFDRAAAMMGEGWLDTVFRGTDAELADTRMAQPALLTAEAAIAAHLKAHGITPSLCAGHSLGEYSALVAADALSFEEAFRLVRERARVMSENVPDGAMAAVLGLDAGTIESLLPEGAQVANYNGPGQTIISGTAAAMEAAEHALKDAGAKRIMRLNVSGPFHSKYMCEARDAFRGILERAVLNAPATRFVSSVSGHEETEPERIRKLLGEQLCAPVRWTDVMAAIGPVEALEVGPGRVLQGLAKRTDKAPSVMPAGTLESAEALKGTQ